MPKRHGNLWDKVIDFDNLHAAYLKARKGHRWTSEVLRFSANLEEELINLQNQLIWGTYRTGPYRFFTIYEPKERLVAALPFRDRVAQHALCNVIGPILERRFIYHSYACRVGKGTHRGADQIQTWLRECERAWGRVYCLKADVAKYFASIDHRILMRILERVIKDRLVLTMCQEIIASGSDTGKGLPIGNLTSQWWANLYLDQLDHFVKEELRVKHYLRYMDDTVFLSPSKKELWQWYREIEGFLEDRLALRLNPKTSIFPVGPRPIDFLGYRIWPTHRLLRRDSVKRMRRKLKRMQYQYSRGEISLDKINASIQSWLGHAKHADTYGLRKKLLSSAVFAREQQDTNGG